MFVACDVKNVISAMGIRNLTSEMVLAPEETQIINTFFDLDDLFQQDVYNPILSKKVAKDLIYIPFATSATMPGLHGYFNSGVLESSTYFFKDASTEYGDNRPHRLTILSLTISTTSF